MKKIILAVVGVASILASTASLSTTPASAMHGTSAHWANQYAPYMSADCNALGGTLCNHLGGAESMWDDAGFAQGFRGGNPYQGCGYKAGWITVCVLPVSQMQNGAAGNTYVYTTSGHIDGVELELCGDCGLNSTQLTWLVRHEMGHAIGLDHNTNGACWSVMHANSYCTAWPDQHDKDELWTDYAYPHSGG